MNAGTDSYAWNVVRSECDDLIFRHAGKCGAKMFDGVKVNGITFVPLTGDEAISESKVENADPGRPTSATWSRKDGSSGEINFDFLVDASGRAGIVSTKYMKNRTFNQDLKNVANWGYWKGAISYGIGTPKEGNPFFEALSDGSGWAWFIPLHNDTTSVGIVMNQAMSTDKKRAAAELNGREYYLQCIQEANGVAHLLSKAELSTDIKYASDWSYSASAYASPYLRIVGDAGAFIDPYFSSGMHLALSGALSAAVTICASIKGDCDEQTAFNWHSQGVTERFTRFLLIVLGATKQIRSKEAPVLNTSDEDGFDKAFSLIRPVIQGRADVDDGMISHADVAKAVDFSYTAVQGKKPGEGGREAKGFQSVNGAEYDRHGQQWQDVADDAFSAEEAKVMKMVKNVFADYFSADSFHGKAARLERGNLGLRDAPAAEGKVTNGQPELRRTNGIDGSQMPVPVAASG